MRFVKDSPLELGFRMWQLRPPQPSLTVVAKGTFDLAAGEPAPFAAEQVPATGEVWVDDDVEQPLLRPSDYALLKPVGEAMVVGKAWAPGGRATTAVACSFRIGALQKRFAVFGDRFWVPGVVARVAGPTPFTEMPLHMGRAYGGPGFAKNPWGRGREATAREEGGTAVFLPNLEDPGRLVDGPKANPDPVVIGALPMMWPGRQRYAGTYGASYMEKRWPWLPEDFDWRFFQEAPPDQRLAEGFFRGDEPIEVEGLHPEHTHLRSRLPKIAPRVCIDYVPREGEAPVWKEVVLKLDTVVWDAEIGKLLCTWRGVVEVPSETLEEIRYLFVAHDPLEGPHRSEAALQARCAAVLRAEEEEEEQAEGEEPPSFDDVTDPTGMPAGLEEEETPEEAPEEEEPLPSPEELAMEAKLAELAAQAPPPPPEPEPRDPLALIAALRAQGPLPPELEELAKELEAPPEPEAEPAVEEIPEPPPDPEGRALVEARLAAGEPLTDLDLSGLDLTGLDLSGRDLSGSILRAANLTGVKLDGALLIGCVLIRANLYHASLQRADLTEADLSQAQLEGADLLGATLVDAVALEAGMAKVRLHEASAARGGVGPPKHAGWRQERAHIPVGRIVRGERGQG